MSIKPEEKYRNALMKLIQDANNLKSSYIDDDPTFNQRGELVIVPCEKFRSLATQALMLTRHYRFVEAQDDRTIFLKLSKLRDLFITEDNQYSSLVELIQLLDAIVSQIESGILCFMAGTLTVTAQGGLDQIRSAPLHYMDRDLRIGTLSDISELIVAVQSKMYKSVALLAGSITEAVLLGVANLNPQISETHIQGSKAYSRRKFPDQCGIEELGYICRNEGILTDSALSMEILRNYRDHIHPNKHAKSQTDLDDHTVNMILGTLGKILKNLADSDSKGFMQKYKGKKN